MLFVIWLCDRGLLRPEDAIEVLRAYAVRQTPIGRIAREEGLMSMSAVMHVIGLQPDRPGRRFGELAVELGYLDQEGLGRLLDAQQRRAPRYEDLLVSLGYFDADRLSAARAEFLRALDDGAALARPGPRTPPSFSGARASA